MLGPIPRARHHGPGAALEELNLSSGVERLPAALDQERLVVEHVALACSPGHKELDDPSGLGRMVQAFALTAGCSRIAPEQVS